MANSVLEIYRLALSDIGARQSVDAVDEQSTEAETCTLWYETTVGAVLRAAPWPAATGHQRLALLSSAPVDGVWLSSSPPPQWTYEFAAPTDMIRPRWLTSWERFDLSLRNTTHTIVTNSPSPILCYTKSQPLVSLWDPQLTMAVSSALGANIAMKLTGKRERAADALRRANDLILAARESVANERDVVYESIPPWLAIRGAGEALSVANFLYPFGPLLSVSGVG